MEILICDDDEARVSIVQFKLTRENMSKLIKALRQELIFDGGNYVIITGAGIRKKILRQAPGLV